jgi:hypothetical protein
LTAASLLVRSHETAWVPDRGVEGGGQGPGYQRGRLPEGAQRPGRVVAKQPQGMEPPLLAQLRVEDVGGGPLRCRERAALARNTGVVVADIFGPGAPEDRKVENSLASVVRVELAPEGREEQVAGVLQAPS